MSIVLAHQPHFLDQPVDVQVFWGTRCFPTGSVILFQGDGGCSGAEILARAVCHLRIDLEIFATANCIPCRMLTSPVCSCHAGRTDRPLPVPIGSKNFAFISQFVEIPEDVVFTVEYSVGGSDGRL